MRLILILSFLITSFLSFGQNSDSKLLSYPRYSIGYTPSSHFNVYSAHQLSHDIGIMDNINLTLETGYIYHSIFSRYSTGYRLRGGVEFLLFSTEKSGFFIGAHFVNRLTNSPAEFTVIYQEGDFSETVEFERKKRLSAGELKFGALWAFNNRLRGEFSLGGGMGNATTVDTDKIFSRGEEEFFFVFNDTVISENFRNGRVFFGAITVNLSYTLFQ